MNEESGTELRRILDRLSEPLRGVPAEELDSLMDGATQCARHGKS